MCNMLPIKSALKQGDALSPLFFNYALEYAISGVQVNQDGLKLKGTHQLLIYDDDDNNILGEIVNSVRKNIEALEVTRNWSRST